MESIYRIIDANFNRAREGLRVLEEVARFCLDERDLSEGLKGARHLLGEAAGKLPAGYRDLLAARDVEGDVGAGTFGASERERTDLDHLVVVNSKRVQEATRVLEEFTKLLSPEVARLCKQSRFKSYELEQQLVFRVREPKAKAGKECSGMKDWELYVITGEHWSLGRPTVEVMEQAIKGGAQVIQLREKHLPIQKLIALGQELRELTRRYGVTFIVNDRVDVAVAVDADGVHLGQDDLPVAAARKILGPDKLIGISTHSVEQALRAEAEGADYIGVGPVFATQSKEDVCAPVGLELVSKVSNLVKIPFVAIGGIKAYNVAEVVKAGASCVAVITGVVGAEDVAGAARELREKLAVAKGERASGAQS